MMKSYIHSKEGFFMHVLCCWWVVRFARTSNLNFLQGLNGAHVRLLHSREMEIMRARDGGKGGIDCFSEIFRVQMWYGETFFQSARGRWYQLWLLAGFELRKIVVCVYSLIYPVRANGNLFSDFIPVAHKSGQNGNLCERERVCVTINS